MFLFFSVISLPCNFCQIQPASELDSPSTTELTGEYIFAPPHSPFRSFENYEKVSAEERKYIRQSVLSWKGNLAPMLAVFGRNCKARK